MPISSELRRVKIGLFHPVLIKILIKKEVRSAMKGQRAKYSAYSQWDCCTDLTFRCLVTTICAVSFLLSMKCVLLCEKNGWFTEEILNWLGGNVKHGLQCSADGPCVLISQKAVAITTTGDIGITPGYVGPPSSLFLMLFGDISRTLDLRRKSWSWNWGVHSVLDSTISLQTCSLFGPLSPPCLVK